MANNLLDKSSIILTPTAYNNGEALCVKPSDASGDFQFSRNSAATRVNAQGLVENVQILSSNLVQNGDFSEEGSEEVSNGSFSQESSELVTNGDFATDSDWDLRGAWVISNGICSLTAPNSNYLSPSTIVFTANKFYKLTFDIVVNSGNLQPQFFDSGFQNIGTYTTSQSVEVYFKSTTTGTLYFKPNSFDGSIDNVSVREVAQNWVFGTGVSIGENKAVFTSTPSGQSVSQNAVASQIPNGTSVKVSFEVLSISSGSFGVYFSGSLVGSLNSVGVATFYFEKGTETSFYIRALGTTTGSITNISVKKVGQNWTLINGTITDKYNASMTAYQSGIRVTPFLNTGTFKVTFDLVVTSGSCKFDAGGANNAIYTTSGTKEIMVTDTTKFEFNAFNLGWVGTLDNVSVIQITDDTNLPRINYEGFSYQDVLGSELVVNGSFDVNGNWTNFGTPLVSEQSSTKYYTAPFSWYVNGDAFRQGIFSPNNFTLTNGKTYNVSLWVYALDGAEILSGLTNTDKSVFTSHAINQNEWTNITYSAFANATSASYISILTSSSTLEFYVDNVSVKEYLGQEVVPDSGCGSWLWEPQSTNLITQSNDLSQWFLQQNAIVSSPTFVSPSGENNANLIDLSADTDARVVLNFGSASTEYTFSVYLKKHESDVNGTFPLAYYNGSNYIKTYVNLTDKWQRFRLTFTNPSGSVFGYGLSRKGTTSDETLTRCYAWGGQQEALSYPTSLIPTSGSQVTRNQDVCTNGGSSASINSTSGTLYAEIAALSDDGTSRRITLLESLDNKVSLILSSTSNSIQGLVVSGGSVQFNQTFATSNTLDFNKIAVSYAENNFALWVNGVKVRTDTSGVTFSENTLTNISFADANNTSNKFFGKTKCVAVWKEALSDAELTELTTI